MSGLSIGLSSNFLVPGTFVLTLFGEGESIQGAADRSVLYIMPKASAGAWQANQIIQVSNEAEARAGAGSGSVMHRALRRHFRTSKKGKVYALPYAPSSGAGIASADGYIALEGTATSAGVVSCTLANETVEVGYQAGTTGEQVGDLLEAKLLGILHAPCTAQNAGGVVTLTAVTPGASQNDCIRFRASVVSGSGITIETSGETLGTGFGTAGVDGSVTELANLESAIAVVQKRYYYICTSLNSTAAISALTAKLVADADPLADKREVGITGSCEANSAVRAKSIAQNYERLMIVNQQYSEWTPEELVASVAAVRAFMENANSRAGFSTFGGDSQLNWEVPPVFDENDWLEAEDTNDSLIDGVTPIQSTEFGSYIVKAVTTHSKDATGSVNDRRSLEPHRISVVDEMADILANRNRVTYAGKDFALKDDPRLPNGEVDQMAKLPPKTVTPRIWSGLPKQILKDFDADGKISNYQEALASLDVQVAGLNPARLEVGINVKVIDLFDQTTIRIAEVSEG